jgi:Transcriptional regulator, AbiEi antitoxin
MRTDFDRTVGEFAAAHHGLVSLRELRDLDVGYEQIRRRVNSGRWHRLYDGVYRLAGAPTTWKSELLAACWAGGASAVASHGSAAALLDLPGGRTDTAEITCPRWRRGQEVGPLVHESKAIDPTDCQAVDNIPVTSAELTLTYESTRALLKRRARRGRNGAGVLRKILDERAPERPVPESPMETRLLWLLRQLGFPPPIPQYEVWYQGEFIGRLDAAYPQRRVGLELQSYEHHAGKLALERDNARRRKFKSIGWEIVEVTAADLRNRGRLLAPTVRIALQRASWVVLALQTGVSRRSLTPNMTVEEESAALVDCDVVDRADVAVFLFQDPGELREVGDRLSAAQLLG